jgi:AcrR family transcriptional regulator
MTKTPLTPRHWVFAGFAALAEGGIEAVRVEPLSRRLKTSKGSFYWHFADRPALLHAMLELWEAEGTGEVIEAVESQGSAAERLRAVSLRALQPTEQGLDTARTEAALRAWAAEDPSVRTRIAEVDRQRINYLHALLVQLGYEPEPARDLAGGLYMTLLGIYSTRRYAPELAMDGALLTLVEQAIAAAPRR